MIDFFFRKLFCFWNHDLLFFTIIVYYYTYYFIFLFLLFLIVTSWTDDSRHIVTGSRDGLSKVWRIVEDSTGLSVTCLHSFSPFDGVSVTAVGIRTHIAGLQ